MIRDDYPHELVLRVNELHHDAEERVYAADNKRMFASERAHWLAFFDRLVAARKRPLCIVELGVGTGFVPTVFLASSANRPRTRYVCTDLSAGILANAKRRLGRRACFSFRKTSADSLPFKTRSVDVVLLNSVLHHLPDADAFFREMRRVLKKGGLLAIGHEPNRTFYRNALRVAAYRFCSSTIRGLGRLKRRAGTANPTNVALNKKLIAEKRIRSPLSDDEIARIVDYRANQGFDIRRLAAKHRFTLLSYRTYNYLLHLSFNYPIWPFRLYERLSATIAPDGGGTFFAVLAKT